jgi:hypothetical protein
MNLLYTSVFFQLIAGLIPVLILFNKELQLKFWLMTYLIASVISTITLLITSGLGIHNVIIFNAYLLIEFICISAIYYSLIKNGLVKKTISFIVLCILLKILYDIRTSNYVLDGFKSTNLFEISLVLFFLFDQLKNDEYSKNESQLTGFSIYFISYKTSVFLLMYYISKMIKTDLWYLHNFIEGSFKLLIAFSFWNITKKSTFSN